MLNNMNFHKAINMNNFIVLALIPLILSIGITPALSFGEIDSPRKQMQNGIAAEDVVCKSGLSLMIRSSGSAACVTSTTADKLESIGWGTIQPALSGEWIPSGIEEKNSITNTQITEKKPNILVIVLDDVGFSDLGFTGSEIDTPMMNSLAENEIFMTNFHVLPTCSPTRSVLLTGVDNHLTGFGSMSEFASEEQKGQPGYEGYLNYNVVTVASLLKDAGYHTYMTGKWHMSYGANVKNMTDTDLEYDNWGKYDPHNRGFEESFSVSLPGGHFSEMGQTYDHTGFYTRNAERVTLPDEFYSGDAYVDTLIEMIDKNHGDEKPMFMYLAFWESHFPIHAPQEYIDKYEGVYDKGWDEIRKDRFELQKELGLIPAELELPARNDHIPAWDELTLEEQARETKKMQVYAGMTDSIDVNIGRTIQHLKDIGEWENTLLFIFSDNGAESTKIDTVWLAGEDADRYDEWMNTNFDDSIEAIGTKDSNASIGPGWAQVGSTPLFREKGYMSEGGIRVPMIVKLPNSDENFKNNTFSHVIDITPTILDYAGIIHPGNSYDGREVHSMEGKSLKSLFEGESDRIYGEEPFAVELFGNKAVYKGEWKALQLVPPFVESAGEWMLFNLAEDIRELNDLSSEHPELLEELKQDYAEYAERVGVIETEGMDIPR